MTVNDDSEATRPPRLRLSIAAALMSSFAGLVFLGVAIVMAILGWTAAENTRSLLGDKASLSIRLMEAELRRLLDPVAHGNAYVRALIESGTVDPTDRNRLIDVLRTSMAAAPQMLGMGFIPMDLKEVVRVSRNREIMGVRLSDAREDKTMRGALNQISTRDDAFWGRPLRTDVVDSVLVNLRTPLRRNAKLMGMLVSVVAVSHLSRRIVEANGNESLVPFILYGENHVLAHRTMISGKYPAAGDLPIPGLKQIDDPALPHIWNEDRERRVIARLPDWTQGRVVDIGGDNYVFFYTRLNGYPGLPLTIGAYGKTESDLGLELRRLANAGAAGLAVLICAVLVALFVGRRMSLPVRQLAHVARRVGALDLQDLPTLGRSRLKDLDEAATAFNGMISALRWFETYVPRKLVRRLVSGGADTEVSSEEREVTVMFTDIAGFTTLAQQGSATETLAMLNAHFSLLARCIEDEDGTVDKYIGDSVMAFWGPPLGDHQHAMRACRAALAIRAAVEADNAARARDGDTPIRIRIGIHTGPAIVGNVGAPGRINYTLVGDSVNVAQRLEQLIKRLDLPETDVDIALSQDVVTAFGGEFPSESHDLVSLGPHQLPGRLGGFEIYTLT